MSKHTPGPWVFDGRDSIVAPDGDLLLLTGVRVPMVAGPDREEARSNARLIAAAPDLLNAAIWALDVLVSCSVPTGGCDDQTAFLEAKELLGDAITKAEGKS